LGRDSSAQQHWNHSDLHRLHEPKLRQAPKQRSAAEQPDISAFTLFQSLHHTGDVFSYNRQLLEVLLPQSSRNNETLHARHCPVCTTCRFKRPAANQHGIELAEDLLEVDLRIHDDPIGLTFRSGDVAVQAAGDD